MEEQQSNYVVTLMHANYIIRHNYIFFIRPKKKDFLKAVRIVTLTKVRERREKVNDCATYPYRTGGVRYLPHCGPVLEIYAHA